MMKQTKTRLTGDILYQNTLDKLLFVRESMQKEVAKKELGYYQDLLYQYKENLTEDGRANKTGRLIDCLKDYEAKYDSLIKGLDQSFMLFVVGSGNYGKSTLINALLETEAAEVNVLPKTWKIDVFRKDIPADKAVIIYRGSAKRKLVPASMAKKIIELEEQKRKNSEKAVSDKLKQYKKQLSSFKAFKDMKLKLEREEIYNSDIMEVHWGMKEVLLLENFYIVDTPGLTQNVMGEVRHSVQDYYHKADGVVWMLDATTIAASNAKKLVEELEESLSAVGGKQQRNIIAVLNRIDLVYNQQGVEGVKQVMKDAERIFKGYFRDIIPLSAKQAFDAQMTKNESLLQVSGMTELLKEIKNTFLKNAEEIQYAKKLESSAAYRSKAAHLIRDYTATLDKDIEKWKDGEKALTKSIRSEREKLLKFAKAKVKDYRSRVEENISYQLDTFLDIKNNSQQQQFIEDNIFETNRLSLLLKDVEEEERTTFSKLADHLINKFTFTEYPYLQQQNQLEKTISVELDISVERDYAEEDLATYGSGFAAGMIASLFLGPFGLLVGGVVGWFVKNSTREKVRGQLKEELGKASVDLSKKLEESINSYGDKTFEFVMENISLSFIEVYSKPKHENATIDESFSKTVEKGEKAAASLTGPAPDFYPSVKEMLVWKGANQ